jgi:hypothetical protein
VRNGIALSEQHAFKIDNRFCDITVLKMVKISNVIFPACNPPDTLVLSLRAGAWAFAWQAGTTGAWPHSITPDTKIHTLDYTFG